MLRNITLEEFEAAVTMRVLLDRMVEPHMRSASRILYTYDDALTQSVFAANDILIQLGINRELWTRVRGKRAYIFHEPTRRIVAELGIDTESVGTRQIYRRRLRVVLVGKRGLAFKDPTIGDLAVSAAKLGLNQNYGARKHNKAKELQHA